MGTIPQKNRFKPKHSSGTHPGTATSIAQGTEMSSTARPAPLGGWEGSSPVRTEENSSGTGLSLGNLTPPAQGGSVPHISLVHAVVESVTARQSWGTSGAPQNHPEGRVSHRTRECRAWGRCVLPTQTIHTHTAHSVHTPSVPQPQSEPVCFLFLVRIPPTAGQGRPCPALLQPPGAGQPQLFGNNVPQSRGSPVSHASR